MDHNQLRKILKELGIPDHHTCFLRNLYAGQDATVRTGHGTIVWFQIGKTQQWPQDWKMSAFILIPKKGNAKDCSYYHAIALISHTSQILLIILPARLQEYVNQEFSDVQAGY